MLEGNIAISCKLSSGRDDKKNITHQEDLPAVRHLLSATRIDYPDARYWDNMRGVFGVFHAWLPHRVSYPDSMSMDALLPFLGHPSSNIQLT